MAELKTGVLETRSAVELIENRVHDGHLILDGAIAGSEEKELPAGIVEGKAPATLGSITHFPRV